MPQLIGATQARESFSEIINRVLYAGEEFVVHRQGRAVVLITQIKTSQKLKVLPKKMQPIDFFNKLESYQLKGVPKDLAKKH